MNHPPDQGALFQSQNGSPCSRDHFVHAVRHALSKAGLNPSLYAGHSCHNRRRCRHSSPHNQEARPLVIRCLHAVRPSIRQLPFTYFYCPRLYIRLLTCRPSCLPLGRHYFYFHFHTFYTIFTTFSAPSMGLITHLPFTHLTS